MSQLNGHNNASAGPSRLSLTRFSPSASAHARLPSEEDQSVPLDQRSSSFRMTALNKDKVHKDAEEAAAAERYDQGVNPLVPDQKDREKEGIGVMMGHSKMSSAPHVKHLPVPVRNPLSAQPSRQPSMSPSATQSQIHDLRPPRVKCAGCLDGPTAKDPQSTTGQWLSELCVGLVLCQCFPCFKHEPKYY